MKGVLNKIKVDKAIKPIPYTKRTTVKLVVGGDYYVSFGSNIVYPCVLLKIIESEQTPTHVKIEIPVKPRSKKGFIDIDGKISHHWTSAHNLFADEIGLTPEEAVINEVTF